MKWGRPGTRRGSDDAKLKHMLKLLLGGLVQGFWAELILMSLEVRDIMLDSVVW